MYANSLCRVVRKQVTEHVILLKNYVTEKSLFFIFSEKTHQFSFLLKKENKKNKISAS